MLAVSPTWDYNPETWTGRSLDTVNLESFLHSRCQKLVSGLLLKLRTKERNVWAMQSTLLHYAYADTKQIWKCKFKCQVLLPFDNLMPKFIKVICIVMCVLKWLCKSYEINCLYVKFQINICLNYRYVLCRNMVIRFVLHLHYRNSLD